MIAMLGKYRKISIFSFLFFLFVVSVTGFTAANCPLTDDDVYFIDVWGCIRHTICPEEDFNPLADAIEHHTSVNGRLGDCFTPLFMLIPSWIYGMIYALCYAAVIQLSMRIARLSFSRTPVKTMWLIGAGVLFYPWQDVLFTRAVFINYFPAVIFTLFTLRLFLKEKNIKGLAVVGYILCAILCGSWHELMPVSLFPSALVYCIATKRVTRNQWLAVTGIGIGFLFILSSPSLFNRVDQLTALTFTRTRIIFAIGYVLLLSAISMAAVILSRKKDFTRHRSRILVVSLTLPLIACAAIMLSSLFEIRMCFLPSVLALTALFYALPQGQLNRIPAASVNILTCFGVVFISIHLIYLAHNSVKVKRASDSILQQLAQNVNEHQYYDLPAILGNNYLMLYKGMGRGYICRRHCWEWMAHYTGSKYSFNVLHPALKNFDLAAADTLNAKEGVYRYGNCLLIDAPCDSTEYIIGSLTINYENAAARTYKFMGPYFEDIHGNKLIYIIPYNHAEPDSKPANLENITFDKACRMPLFPDND